MPITFQQLEEQLNRAVGRMHMAEAVVDAYIEMQAGYQCVLAFGCKCASCRFHKALRDYNVFKEAE